MKKAAKSIRNDICGLNTTSEKIAKAAELIAWPYGTSEKKYWRNNSEYGYMGNICFSSWKKVKQKTGKPTEMFMKVYDDVRPTHFSLCGDRWGNHTSIGASCDVFAGTVVRATGYEKIGFGLNTQTPHLNSSKKWKKVNTPKRGDFCNISSHSAIYLGNNRMAEAGYLGGDGGYFGHIKKGKCGGMNIYRATK